MTEVELLFCFTRHHDTINSLSLAGFNQRNHKQIVNKGNR